MAKKVGFLVNPIAGMGGKVGLKGTDGKADEALKLGAAPLASDRASEFLTSLKSLDCVFLTCSGQMGESVLENTTVEYEVVYNFKGDSTAKDTKLACAKFLEDDVDIIAFCGGDGTACDIYDVVTDTVPVLGIPAGVKMYSSAFAVNPAAAAKLLSDYLSKGLNLMDAEIMDINEDAFRQNYLVAELKGIMKIPYEASLVQLHKEVFATDEESSKKGIAVFATQFMRDGSAYILGPGSTVNAIIEELGLKGSLLGVDVVKDGKLLAKDANEKQLLELLKENKKAKIIVSPIGAQGFIFGRGNQQISAKVISKVGVANSIIVATESKLENTPKLYVDTGSANIDKKLAGYQQVVCGYHMAQRRKIHGRDDRV